VVIQWPGGVNMQLYWHTATPHYAPLATVPENRIYLTADAADAFLKSWGGYAHAKITADNRKASGAEVGQSGKTIRRIALTSNYGKMVVFVSDGQLPWPYGRDMTGYQVPDLAATLDKAKANGPRFWSRPIRSAPVKPRLSASPAAISPKCIRAPEPWTRARSATPMIDAILEWPGTWTIARLALVGPYLLGGMVKLTDLPAAAAEQAHFGLNPPMVWAALTIAVELIGPLLVLSGGWCGWGRACWGCSPCWRPAWPMPSGPCPPGRTASWPPTPFSNISAWSAALCWSRWSANGRARRG
jgi:hypothetical protein